MLNIYKRFGSFSFYFGSYGQYRNIGLSFSRKLYLYAGTGEDEYSFDIDLWWWHCSFTYFHKVY